MYKYDPMQPYQQDFLNGFQSMSSRNPMQAARAVAPPVIPKASGRIGSLPSPKKKAMQPIPGSPEDPSSWAWSGGRDQILKVPQAQPQLPAPSPVPQQAAGLPEPSPAPVDRPPMLTALPPRGQTVYESLPSFSSPGQMQAAPGSRGWVVPGQLDQEGRQYREGPGYASQAAYEAGQAPITPGGGPVSLPMIPGRPGIPQSYAMPSQRPGFLPQGMQQAPLPVYQPGAQIGTEDQQLMRAVMRKQLMDQLNYQTPQTGPGVTDSLMQLASGFMPGGARYLDNQVANIQSNRQRNAQAQLADNDNRRAWSAQMLQSITANDPLSLQAQDQLFGRQSDWQKNQIAGINAGTQAFQAEDGAQRWRAQLPSEQWVAQQGATNQAGQVANQGRANDLRAQEAIQEQQRAAEERRQRMLIEQMHQDQFNKELDWKRKNSQLQYGANGIKPKQASPADIAKAMSTLYNKDGTPKLDPKAHQAVLQQLATQMNIDPALLVPDQSADQEDTAQPFDLGGMWNNITKVFTGQQQSGGSPQEKALAHYKSLPAEQRKQLRGQFKAKFGVDPGV